MPSIRRSTTFQVFALIATPAIFGLLFCACAEKTKRDERAKLAAAIEAALQAAESKLLSAPTVRISCNFQLAGSVEAAMKGSLVAEQNNVLKMEFEGRVGSNPVSVSLTSDGKTMKYGPGNKIIEQPTPSDLRTKVLTASIRRGLIQGVMDLLDGQIPNRTDGTVEDQVKVSNFVYGEAMFFDNRKVKPVNYDIHHGGDRSGQGTMWLADDTGLPVQRVAYLRLPKEEVLIEKDVFELAAADSKKP